MREIRQSGSEGGGSRTQSVLPTPIGFGHDGGFCTPWLRQVGQCIVRPYERLFTDFVWCSDVRVKIEPCLGGKMQFSV